MKYVAIAAAVLGLAAINTAGTAKAEDFGVTIRAVRVTITTGIIIIVGGATMPAQVTAGWWSRISSTATATA